MPFKTIESMESNIKCDPRVVDTEPEHPPSYDEAVRPSDSDQTPPSYADAISLGTSVW